MKITLGLLFTMMSTLLLSGCGGESTGLPSQPNTCERVVSIQVAPQKHLSQGVSIDQLPIGVDAQYEATLIYCDGTTRVTTEDVTWAVSNEHAAISASGLASTVSAGSVEITATLDQLISKRTLQISGVTLTRLTVSPPNTAIPKGMAQHYSAQGNYSDGTTLDVTTLVTWSSSEPAVTGINASGLATGLTVGHTTVTATLDGQSASTSLTVTNATLTELTITPPNATIPKGMTQHYNAQGNYSDGTALDVTALATWSSSTPVVTAINASGLAAGLSEGNATVTATLDGQNTSANLTVTSATLVGLTVTPADTTIPKGIPQHYSAQGNYSDGTTLDVTTLVAWSSSAPTVTSINTSGLATAINEGNATVTAALDGQSISANLTVTSAILTGLTITPLNATIPKGTTQGYKVQGSYSDGAALDVTP
ncbi:Ig-like domain-containing protein [Iodobacter ciconiae]|uniref:BIG2 domain-containing protein n=1 Tax=Iodobacter ciconiae TaxID=2496266 RepID=A0A3S8ZSU9_9NEIS|nr:Ig-like domain-containing protein [Iodobacter ciconiae]AZN36562.1 hypothetical protein EJO50_08665 [Iodobacter ciconiae]